MFQTFECMFQTLGCTFQTLERRIFLGTKTFDIKPVQEVKVKQLLGIDREADKVSQAEMCYYFEYCCNELRKYLNNIMLKDIEVLQ